MARDNVRRQSFECLDFIERHFDMVSQEEYFDLCAMVAELIADVAHEHGFVGDLISKYPDFYYDPREGESLI